MNIIIFSLGFFFLGLSWGWGRLGHQMTALIANKFLSPEALSGVSDILKSKTMMEISTWADEMKEEKKYQWSYPLHYCNLNNPDEPNSCSFSMSRDCPKGNCIIGALYNFSRQITDKSLPSIQNEEALKFFVHCILTFINHSNG
jgi:hypothetical protein